MCIQVVLHQANVLDVRIDFIDEPTHDLGVVVHRALRRHFHMPPPCQWFHHDEEIARAFSLVFVIHPLRMTWWIRQAMT
jgi:hypothetical protein